MSSDAIRMSWGRPRLRAAEFHHHRQQQHHCGRAWLILREATGWQALSRAPRVGRSRLSLACASEARDRRARLVVFENQDAIKAVGEALRQRPEDQRVGIDPDDIEFYEVFEF